MDTSESYDLFIFNLWQFLDRVEGEEMEILLFQLNSIHALLVWLLNTEYMHAIIEIQVVIQVSSTVPSMTWYKDD